jgi:uncharacterized protein (DUF1501 family)
MKRRSFIRNVGGASLGPLLLNGLNIKSFADLAMLPLLNCQGIDDRVLVVVFLKGANDGLNTIVPINQYDTYANLRPNIKLSNVGQTNGLLNLDSSLAMDRQVGIHPSMTAFKDMYEQDKATLIQAVGYPLPNKSHFKATDLWLSGGDGTLANSNLGSGWLGRYLDSAYPGVNGFSTPEFPDPLGIQFGDMQPSFSLTNHAQEFEGLNLTNQNLTNLSGLLNGLGSAPHTNLGSSDFEDKLSFIMEVENSTNAYGNRITSVYNAGSNSNVTYPSSDLANQFKSIAKLLSGGSQTKVFLAHKGGFDTHNSQVVTGSTHTGTHATLLQDVFSSIKAFHDDLQNLGIGDRVVTVTFSEFGRKMIENGSVGTDHGNFAPLFLFGNPVKTGVIGNNINLSQITADGNLVESGTNNQLQHDYRRIFKTLLQDWLGAGSSIITNTYFDPYGTVNDLLNTVVPSNCYFDPICYTYVTSSNDMGNGSLRHLVDCVPNDTHIKIATSNKINKTSTVVDIDKNIKISPYNSTPIIQNYGSAALFNINPGMTLELENLQLIGNINAPLFQNSGTLILRNCILKVGNANSGILGSGNVIIDGTTVIKGL